MHNVFRLFSDDLRRLFSNVVSVIITVGLIVMPSIFAWYNVIACWDVFENTGNLKVAVANVDEGYESDLVPLRVNVGEQVVSELRANDQIDWTFTTEEDAIDGAKSGRYYAAVVIPKTFSRDMLTFYQDDMQHAKIIYYANEKKSAIAPKITDQGADSVSAQVNQVFVKTMSDVALGLADSLVAYMEESDADGRIAELADHMRDAADQMDRAAAVMVLYSSLTASSQQLIADSAQLVDSARTQIGEVAETAQGASQAALGALDAVKQSAEELSSALDAAEQAFSGVSENIDRLFDSVDSVSSQAVSGMRSQADALDAQAASFTAIVDSLNELKASAPDSLIPAIDSAIASLEANAQLMSGMAADLRSAADKVESGNADISAERDHIHQLAEQAQAGIAAMRDDFEQNLKPGLQSLADQAASFAESLGTGIAALDGLSDGLSDSAGTASSLLGQAGGDIEAAAGKITEIGESLRGLADGIDEALASGDPEQLREILGSDISSLAAALSAPVGIERTALYPVANFGSAMAPLYTSLALFIGSLLILVAIKPTVSDRVRSKLDDPKPRHLFFGRFGVMSVVSFAQTTLMGLGNLLFLQVQVVHPLLFMLCFWLAGQVFTFLIYALVASFANLGKAIAVLLLIVQVTGCNGSYPLQILPSFVQALSPYLPATHVVGAMRAAMFGTYGYDFWMHMGALALFILPALALGLVLRKPLEKFMGWYVEQVESSKLIG